jgi:GT2 family glycosyltransferase
MQNNKTNRGISVVIPNYNGRQLLEQNLSFTYAALKAANIKYEVIVSDDASTDESVAFITENYPDIILIENLHNGGFSVNINRGIAAASLELVLLLNSDIKLSEEYFKTQLQYFDSPNTFGVMGQVLDEASGQVLEACKYPLSSFFKINHFKNIQSDKSNTYTYYLSGANALVAKDKLLELEGFNELFSPYYHEDLDLSLRAWENGWKCYYDCSAICRHAVSTTIKAYSSKKAIKVISTRNKLLLHYFHHTGIRLYLWQLVTLLSLLVRWITGKFYYYKAYTLYLQKLPAMQARKQQFIATAKAKRQYIPFITVKEQIKQALDIKNEPSA